MANDKVREVAADIYCIDVNHPKPQTTCCYLIRQGKAALIIDCGGGRRGAAQVMAGLAALSIPPDEVCFLLATHAHLDHAGAAGALMQQLPQAVFAAHPSAVKHLVDPQQALAPASRALFGDSFFDTYYGGLLPVPAARARALADGETLSLNGRDIAVIYTPGHAWHHISFYDKTASFIAAGDAYGVSYRQLDCDGTGLLVPVMPPSQFNPAAMEESIRRLYGLEAAQTGLTHYDVIDTGKHGEYYLQAQLQALDEWQVQAQALFAETREGFQLRMRAYLMDWIDSRVAARGGDRASARQLHENDCMLSAGGFEYYLNKTAAA